MIAPTFLILFAFLVNSAGSRLLVRARWTDRAPGLAIVVWQSLAASVLLAMTLAGLALALPVMPGTSDLAAALEACSTALRHQYQTPGGAGLSIAGIVLAGGVIGRIGYCLIAALRTIGQQRGAQSQIVALSARRDERRGISIVDHPAAAAYCIPGRNARTRNAGVVVTTGALASLDDLQLDAVIAHERAHLRGRHDLVLAFAGALRRAFPRLACARLGRSELSRLVEMRADDVALRTNSRATLAHALVNLSQGQTPQGALGAGGDALARLRRLTAPRRPLSRPIAVLLAGSAMLLIALPVLVVSEPAVIAALMDYCPLTI